MQDEWQTWRAQASQHHPLHSGRQAQHAAVRGKGPADNPNLGLGRGFAEGTFEAHADFRKHTRICRRPGCDALVDEHWNRRYEIASGTECGWCQGNRSCRKRHLRNQLKLASELESGDRRLTLWKIAADGHRVPWAWPPEACHKAAQAARKRVAVMEADPPKRGRPKTVSR